MLQFVGLVLFVQERKGNKAVHSSLSPSVYVAHLILHKLCMISYPFK